MTRLAAGVSWVDLLFTGRAHAIATAVLSGGGELALVDPGPTACLDKLELGLQAQGAGLGDVTHIFLTHVHLDHAAATGAIVRRYPQIKVFVHERGARHMADPSRLVASAARLWGDDMDRLWGEVAPVPPGNLVALAGGECIDVAGRSFDVAYTPGHASHHVSYFDRSSGVAFVGDTAGMQVDGGYVLPPTPPPDIDLEAWHQSTERIQRWDPQTLFVTHFGPVGSPRSHLQTLTHNLETSAGIAKRVLELPVNDEERSRLFAEALMREMLRSSPGTQLAVYSLAAPLDMLWLGLARYWRTRGNIAS